MFKIIIIEDEEMIRKGLKHMVDWTGLDCVVIGEAKNGEEGVQKINELQPDIILLDINMPIKSGLELLEETTEKNIFSTIILSGYDEFDYAKQAISYGVEQYLLKPIDHNKLNEAIIKAKESIQLKRQYDLIKRKLVKPDDIELLKWDLWNHVGNKPINVSKMIQYIENNYDKNITMSDLVEQIGMSATYLNNLFRENTNYTFNDFLNRYRIQKAIEYIRFSEEKISTIATEVGFGSYRYFIRVFKKYTNALPSDFYDYFRKDRQEF